MIITVNRVVAQMRGRCRLCKDAPAPLALRTEQPIGWPMKAPQPDRWSGYYMELQERTIDN
jgi:hypothetical protein